MSEIAGQGWNSHVTVYYKGEQFTPKAPGLTVFLCVMWIHRYKLMTVLWNGKKSDAVICTWCGHALQSYVE